MWEVVRGVRPALGGGECGGRMFGELKVLVGWSTTKRVVIGGMVRQIILWVRGRGSVCAFDGGTRRHLGAPGGTQGGCVGRRIQEGGSFCDVSAWYWAASLGRTRGPWWAVTVVER